MLQKEKRKKSAVLKRVIIALLEAAVPFWGTNYLKSEWFVPKTGLRL